MLCMLFFTIVSEFNVVMHQWTRNPRATFDAVDVKKRGELDEEDVAQLMREMDRDYSDIEVEMMMQTLDLNHNGRVGFDEFTKVFIGDIRTTQSM